jgi:hypothetical protein
MMAKTRQALDRKQQKEFFDQVTKEISGQDVTIEVLDREFGDQLEAERLPLSYIEYDYHDDVLTVAVGGRDSRYPVVLQHMILHPTEILVDASPPNLPWAFEVPGSDGTRSLVTVHERPALPPPRDVS